MSRTFSLKMIHRAVSWNAPSNASHNFPENKSVDTRIPKLPHLHPVFLYQYFYAIGRNCHGVLQFGRTDLQSYYKITEVNVIHSLWAHVICMGTEAKLKTFLTYSWCSFGSWASGSVDDHKEIWLESNHNDSEKWWTAFILKQNYLVN